MDNLNYINDPVIEELEKEIEITKDNLLEYKDWYMDWVGEEGWSDEQFFIEIMDMNNDTEDDGMLSEMASYLKGLNKALEIANINKK